MKLPFQSYAIDSHIALSDLVFLQASSNYSWLHWKDGRCLLTPRTLKYYEPQLPDNVFVRPHRNCIVNLQYIERLEQCYPDKGGLLHLRSGVVVPVSRRRWLTVKKQYQQMQLGRNFLTGNRYTHLNS